MYELIGVRCHHHCDVSNSHGALQRTDYVVYLRDCAEKRDLYRFTVTNSYGDCMSGWCGATWSQFTALEKMGDREAVGTLHYVPNDQARGKPCQLLRNDGYDRLVLVAGDDRISENGQELLDVEHDSADWLLESTGVGSDDYYPNGEAVVNTCLLEPTSRFPKVQPFYFVHGDSAEDLNTWKSGLEVQDRRVATFDEAGDDTDLEKIAEDLATCSVVFFEDTSLLSVTAQALRDYGSKWEFPAQIAQVHMTRLVSHADPVATVYVLMGPSNSGKSYLAHMLSATFAKVYESDQAKHLPSLLELSLQYNVVVVGQKYCEHQTSMQEWLAGLTPTGSATVNGALCAAPNTNLVVVRLHSST